MSEFRHRRLSLVRPVTHFVVILVLVSTLTVLWHVRLVHDYNKLRALASQDVFHWTFIALGSVLFLAIIVLSSLLGGQLISHIKWSRRQSNFIASVSHELNSPLSSIKLFAQTLRQQDLSKGDRLNFVAKILFDVERLQRLIANILRAAEVDNRGHELLVVTQRVDLHEYLKHYIEDAATLNAKDALQISLAGDRGPRIRLDPMMFRQVLDNLIDNAVRYAGDKPPQVEIRVKSLAEWLQIRIQDHGVGIASENLARIFDRFVRIETQVGKRHGTGIGLYVVRSIVQAHGGRIRAESLGSGKGLTISIQLPLALREQSSPEGRPSRVVKAQAPVGELEPVVES
jgi:signal transduction histidine kinase